MTSGQECCGRCLQSSEYLFPGPSAGIRVCSPCYEALRLHRQGVLLNNVGLVAIVLGIGLLTIVALMLAY